MKTYRATYRYYVKDFNANKLIRRETPCWIVGETERSYRIKLIGGNGRRMPNDPFWVRRKSIVERSYVDKESGRCDIYGFEPKDGICRGCLYECLRRKVILGNEK